MNLWQFIKTQGLLFFLSLVSIFITGGAQGVWANLTMNILTFVTAGWLLSRHWRHIFDLPTVWAAVLAATLSFNGVTYLISYAAYIPLPDWTAILQDFALVTILSIIGILLGLRKSQTESQE